MGPSQNAALPSLDWRRLARYDGPDYRLAFSPSIPHIRKAGGRRKGGIDMGIFSWIILGLIAGFIGSKIVNKTGSGMIMDIVLGVVGAIVGGVSAPALGIGGVSGLNFGSIISPSSARSSCCWSTARSRARA